MKVEAKKNMILWHNFLALTVARKFAPSEFLEDFCVCFDAIISS